MNVDTKTLNKILTLAGHKRGSWNRSGRVNGWGTTSEGFQVERLFDSKFIERNKFARQQSRRWKEVKTTTGYCVEYFMGDWFKGDYAQAQKQHTDALQATLEAAGIAVERHENKLTIKAA